MFYSICLMASLRRTWVILLQQAVAFERCLARQGHRGPQPVHNACYHFRHYRKADEESLPSILKACMELFRSEALFLLLSNFTGLKLHFLAPGEEEEGEGGKEAGGDLSRSAPGQSSQGETDSRDYAEDSERIPESGDSGR